MPELENEAANFWEDRYRTQHDTLHRTEDALAEARAEIAEAVPSLREAMNTLLQASAVDRWGDPSPVAVQAFTDAAVALEAITRAAQPRSKEAVAGG